jgi:hypothetical protein
MSDRTQPRTVIVLTPHPEMKDYAAPFVELMAHVSGSQYEGRCLGCNLDVKDGHGRFGPYTYCTDCCWNLHRCPLCEIRVAERTTASFRSVEGAVRVLLPPRQREEFFEPSFVTTPYQPKPEQP